MRGYHQNDVTSLRLCGEAEKKQSLGRRKYLWAKLAGCAVAAVLFQAGGAGAAVLVSPINFSGSDLASNNFRAVGTSTITVGTDGTNRFLQCTAQGKAVVYDTTPADATPGTASTFAGPFTAANPLIVSFDMKATVTNASVGVYFLDPANEGAANNTTVLSLMNIDNGTSPNQANDQVQLSFGAQVNGTGIGTPKLNSFANLPAGTSAADSGITTTSGFTNVVVKYWTSGTDPLMSLTVPSSGGGTGSFTYSVDLGAGRALTNPEIGLRFSNGSGSSNNIMLTNFAVYSGAIPGTSSAVALLTNTNPSASYSAMVGTANPGNNTPSSTITLTGAGNGSYNPGYLNSISSNGNKGYVTIAGFTPGDAVIGALSLTVNGSAPTSGDLTQLINDLNAGATGLTAVSFASLQSSNLAAYNALKNNDPNYGTDPLEIAFLNSGSYTSANPTYLALDFSGESGSLGNVLVTDIAAIPEPGTIGLVTALGAFGLLSRRRRRPA